MSNRFSPMKINIIMNVLLTLSSIIFPMITLPYVTRVLGAEGVGRVFFASSAISLFAVFAELGIPVYGIRACAKVRDDRAELSRTVREIMAVNLIVCAVVYAVFAIALITVPQLRGDRLLLVIMSSTMLLNAVGVEWLYKALEKYVYITVRSVLFKLAALFAMFLMVRSENDYNIYGAITIFASSASNIVNLCGVHRYADLRPSGRHDLRRHIPAMLMLFALAAATTIYTSLDLAILDLFKGHGEAGMYGVSIKIKLVVVRLITSVSAVLLPRNSFYYEKKRISDFYDLLAKTLNIMVAVSVPVACYFVLFARESIMLLAGEGFAGSVRPMQIIMPAVILIGISNIIGMQMLVPSDREKAVTLAAGAGAVTDLILNLLLIPRYASSGAAAATFAAEIVVFCVLLSASREDMRRIINDIDIRQPAAVLAASATSAAAVSWVKLTDAGTFMRLAVSAVLFFGIYTVLMAFFWRKNGLLHRN